METQPESPRKVNRNLEVKKEQNSLKNNSEYEGRLVGFYTQKERVAKIRKYKTKIQRWRLNNKNAFNGRSRVAKTKLRYFGRFIKKDDLNDKILTDDQIIKNNQEIEEVTMRRDFNKLVDIIAQNPSEIK